MKGCPQQQSIPSTHSAFTISQLSFAWNDRPILNNINLQIDAGDFVCILGQSGCGKSTLLRLLAGLENPASGNIDSFGHPLNGAGLDRGVVFQDYALFPWLNVGKNLLLAIRQRYPQRSRAEMMQIAHRSLQDVGLGADVLTLLPNQLSGGMRQRCAIARALVLDPPILLMDEPFGALDAVTRARLQDMMLALSAAERAEKRTVIFVTHDVDEALLLANRIILLGAGRIIHSHLFHTKPTLKRDEMFSDPAILALRNRLIQVINQDIQHSLQA